MKRNKLIVVLGMHRSGTSAITRGLQVMNVSLGERLIPAIEDNNSKGFWEDIELNALDNEMLHVIDSDWCHVTTIEQFDIENLHKQGYFLRAVELLREKVSNIPVFGIKDPRVAKLLPFWKEVFSHCKYDVNYVFAIRHPLSVAKSLTKRDSLERTQSYLLWLGHVMASLTGSAGNRRVLIDYDRLMQSPDHELERIAKHLGLEIDGIQLRSYKLEFLDESLRHSVCELQDLFQDDACPNIVREVYTELLNVACDRAGFDELENKIETWSVELARLKPTLKLADKLFVQKQLACQTVADRDVQIANLTQASAERDGQIVSLNQTVVDRDAQIANLAQASAEKDGQIVNLNQAIVDRDVQIANLAQASGEKDGQIVSLNQTVADRDAQIANLNQSLAEWDGQITNLNYDLAKHVERINGLERGASLNDMRFKLENEILDEREAQIAELIQNISGREMEYQSHVAELEKAVWAEQQCNTSMRAEIDTLHQHIMRIMSSRSWRLTSPLRKVMTLAVELPRSLSKWPRTVYQRLPISSAQKLKLKHFMFVTFGFALTRSTAYRNWKEYRQIQTEWPAAEPTALTPSTDISVATIANTLLQTADGSWEWRDYDAVKSRITQLKTQQVSQVAPAPLDMIDIGHESFESAAARVKLPVHPDVPDVSIILPVFNNLKLTLECLLSITEHVDERISFEIILADDASTDGTELILSKIANLRLIRNDKNLGFLRNCNKALEHVRGRYIVYLNNDVQVTRGWLVNLYETFTTQQNVGAAGSRFVYPSGHLQEAGVAFRYDGTADMVGLNDDSEKPRYNYVRRVDYISGACLMLPTALAQQLKGFSEDFLPCYCEDSDLCLRVQAAGYYVYYNPSSTIIHHLSKTTAAFDSDFKLKSISANLVKLQQKWIAHLDQATTIKTIAFYLPQFHPFPENDHWWGNGFTEWTNVTKAQPNFLGHYQPRLPADLGFYDLRLSKIMQQQADLARRYGIHGFCYYYYWFGGKRLLEQPIEQMLATGTPDMPFCLCWANENWTRRWDGQANEILMGQEYSPKDDEAVITDLIRYFRDSRYIRIDGRPMILVYRVTLFPDFSATVARWRNICRDQGIGEIYVAMVESMELVHANKHPREFGCDAAVEFPPLEMAEQKSPSGAVINPEFAGAVCDYRDIAVRYATREFPGYTRFKGVMPGWDNTARMQNKSYCFEHATPGTFQAWLEETIEQTRQQHYGDERLVFVNAWNEWAEGAYLEPDRRFGHTFLEAVKNATEAARLLRRNKYWHGN